MQPQYLEALAELFRALTSLVKTFEKALKEKEQK